MARFGGPFFCKCRIRGRMWMALAVVSAGVVGWPAQRGRAGAVDSSPASAPREIAIPVAAPVAPAAWVAPSSAAAFPAVQSATPPVNGHAPGNTRTYAPVRDRTPARNAGHPQADCSRSFCRWLASLSVNLTRKSNAAVQNRSMACSAGLTTSRVGRHATEGIVINAPIARLML
jgi:hypothetical protein